MQQGPSWENNSCSANQFPRTQSSLPCWQKPSTGPCSEPGESSHTITSCFSTLLSMHRSTRWFLPFRFCDQMFVCLSHHFCACYMPCPSPPPPEAAITIWCTWLCCSCDCGPSWGMAFLGVYSSSTLQHHLISIWMWEHFWMSNCL